MTGFSIEDGREPNLLSQHNTALLPPSDQTLVGCKWRTLYGDHQCPDPEINFYHYFGPTDASRMKVNPLEKNSLQEILWDPHKHNIIYIHGYGSGDSDIPTTILRDAYLTNGSYNVFVVDWSAYSKIPCYSSAVHNINAVAKCTAQFYRSLRSQGVRSDRITCVGHNLGAHGCGLISKHVNFRINKIIGLDPAGPMVPNSSKLKSGMANYVQAIYTNAGRFADSISNGRANICINGGKAQPNCRNSTIGSDLCSHLVSVCYMAESIAGSITRRAQPCARQCPFGSRKGQGPGKPVLVGQLTPDKVTGSYCLFTNDEPYCTKNGNKYGHPWCCTAK
ncbi:hypothetical protein RUM44_012342 [Polyplax serrata]|uniref:Lipase domain-containing protein n=1 Tax=Polyplax serrata TaxID=468196 RepID=A0ABR1BD52_POLSC